MGLACELVEQELGSGSVALFINGDAGDIDPAPGMCDGKPKFKVCGMCVCMCMWYVCMSVYVYLCVCVCVCMCVCEYVSMCV